MVVAIGRGGWALGSAVLVTAAAGCGGVMALGSSATGVAFGEEAIAGTVTLTDSSAQLQERQASTRPDGSYAVSLAELTPPYLIKVEWSNGGSLNRLYAVADGGENLDVNPFTDLAYGGAAGSLDREVFFHLAASSKLGSSSRARALLDGVCAVLAPLLRRYGITDPLADKLAVRALLEDVKVVKRDGVVTITHRRTGGVIFTGPLSDPESGTFDPSQMPDGPGPTPTPDLSTTSSIAPSAVVSNGNAHTGPGGHSAAVLNAGSVLVPPYDSASAATAASSFEADVEGGAGPR